jgi:hypothetical protein
MRGPEGGAGREEVGFRGSVDGLRVSSFHQVKTTLV